MQPFNDNQAHGHNACRHRRGPSSFGMHDPEVVFDALKLKAGDFFLDLGCGPGDYALEASRRVGSYGAVYALDKGQYLIDRLIAEADSQGLRNISAMISDITGPLPVEGNCIDLCLLATVLHIFHLGKVEKWLFNEIRRVLKPNGRVAIIECKKEEQPFGPPKHVRLSPDRIEDSIQKYGFEKLSFTDLGYNYLVQFSIRPSAPNSV